MPSTTVDVVVVRTGAEAGGTAAAAARRARCRVVVRIQDMLGHRGLGRWNVGVSDEREARAQELREVGESVRQNKKKTTKN